MKRIALFLILLPIISFAENKQSSLLSEILEKFEESAKMSSEFEIIFSYSLDDGNMDEFKQNCFNKLDLLHAIYETNHEIETQLKLAISASESLKKEKLIKAKEKLESAQNRINDTLYNIESIFAQSFPENITMFMDEAQAYFKTACQLLDNAKSEITEAINN